MPGQRRQTSDLLETAERRAFVLDLRKSGTDYRTIAAQVIDHFGMDRLPKKYDERQAWQDVYRELQRINRERNEGAEEVRQLELTRLDRLQSAVWLKALNGDMAAIDRVLRIMERRARFLGLDAPQKQEVAGAGGGPLILGAIRIHEYEDETEGDP